MRRDTATQIDPFDFPEFAIRQDGRELQRLVEGGRNSGGLEIVEGEGHIGSLAESVEPVISQKRVAMNQ